MLGTNSIKMVVKKAAKYYVANKEVLREDVRKKKKIKKKWNIKQTYHMKLI